MQPKKKAADADPNSLERKGAPTTPLRPSVCVSVCPSVCPPARLACHPSANQNVRACMRAPSPCTDAHEELTVAAKGWPTVGRLIKQLQEPRLSPYLHLFTHSHARHTHPQPQAHTHACTHACTHTLTNQLHLLPPCPPPHVAEPCGIRTVGCMAPTTPHSSPHRPMGSVACSISRKVQCLDDRATLSAFVCARAWVCGCACVRVCVQTLAMVQCLDNRGLSAVEDASARHSELIRSTQARAQQQRGAWQCDVARSATWHAVRVVENATWLATWAQASHTRGERVALKANPSMQAQARPHTRMHPHTHTLTHTHTHTHTRSYTHAHTHTHTLMHTRTLTHTHTRQREAHHRPARPASESRSRDGGGGSYGGRVRADGKDRGRETELCIGCRSMSLRHKYNRAVPADVPHSARTGGCSQGLKGSSQGTHRVVEGCS